MVYDFWPPEVTRLQILRISVNVYMALTKVLNTCYYRRVEHIATNNCISYKEDAADE